MERSHDSKPDQHKAFVCSLLTGRPSPPTTLMKTAVHKCSSTDVTFTWEPPVYSGNVIIDTYTLTVNGNSTSVLSHQTSLTFFLHHRASYQASVTASNCAGTSAASHLTVEIGKHVSCVKQSVSFQSAQLHWCYTSM